MRQGLLTIKCGARTDKGTVRDINEDYLLINKVDRRKDLRGLYAVADGMGGANAGDVASQMVIKAYATLAHSTPGFAKKGYKYVSEQLLALANTSIYEVTQNNPSQKGMCTTFTGIMLEDNRLHLAHVGDSRAYVQRFGRLQQVSEEHSYYAELLRQGKLTPAQFKEHTDNGVILRAIGLKNTLKADFKSISIEDGDVILLSTDGLTDLVTDSEINRILLQSNKPQKAADNLVDLAISRGGADNITVIVLFVGRKKTDRQNNLFLIASIALLMMGSMALGLLGQPIIKAIKHKLAILQHPPAPKPQVKPVPYSAEKHFGVLTILTNPADAYVVVDDQTLNDKTPLTVQLETGKKHLITIGHPACEVKIIDQEFFKESSTETLELELTPIMPKVEVPKLAIPKPKVSPTVRKPVPVITIEIPTAPVIQAEKVVAKPIKPLISTQIAVKELSKAKEQNIVEDASTVLLIQVNVTDYYFAISGEGIDVPATLSKRNILRRTGFDPGQYVLSFSKDGYVDQELKVKLQEGKTTQINVDLVKDFK